MLTTDERYMARCLQLARNGAQEAKPNPMVGAVIVAADGRIIGEGYHVRCGEAHGEVNAFASVSAANEALLPQATIYVSLEPCAHYGKTPPCANLIVSKGVRRCVVGCIDTFAQVSGKGIEILRKAGIEVTVGVLEKECRELNRHFFTYHSKQRPYILLKWAQTANGFIDDHGKPLAISSPYTTMLVHQLRASVDAIVVGRVTDEREHPRLDVRHWSGKSPKRIVVDHRHPLSMESLYHQHIQTLLVEGGAITHQRLMAQGLWDEIRVETAPITVSSGTPAPTLPPDALLTEQHLFDNRVIRVYRRNRAS